MLGIILLENHSVPFLPGRVPIWSPVCPGAITLSKPRAFIRVGLHCDPILNRTDMFPETPSIMFPQG